MAVETEFPERAKPENPAGYLVVQRNLEFLRDQYDAKKIGTADILDGAITSPKLADNSVTSAKIVDGTIVTADIAAAAGIEGQKFDWNVSTTPPASPVTGTMWIYPGAGFYWMFIYDNAEATYKWKFVGGGRLVSQVPADTGATWAQNVWVQPYGSNPSVTMPRSGDYFVEAGCSGRPAAAASWAIGIQIAGSNPGVYDGTWTAGAYAPVAGARSNVHARLLGGGFSSGQVLALVYIQASPAQVVNVNNRYLAIQPVRVI